jgi:glutaryl-CoA dehydrogenase
MSAYRGLDYYQLDDLLTEEEVMVRDTTRGFVTEHVMPGIGEAYENAEFPRQLVPMIAELGLLGPTLPEEYGCAGLGPVAYGLICQELERGDSGLSSFVSVLGCVVMCPIFAYGC